LRWRYRCIPSVLPYRGAKLRTTNGPISRANSSAPSRKSLSPCCLSRSRPERCSCPSLSCTSTEYAAKQSAAGSGGRPWRACFRGHTIGGDGAIMAANSTARRAISSASSTISPTIISMDSGAHDLSGELTRPALSLRSSSFHACVSSPPNALPGLAAMIAAPRAAARTEPIRTAILAIAASALPGNA